MLGKVDAQTTENMPEGSASLKGARFEVTYYDVQGQGNQDSVSKSVADGIAGQAKTTRTWTYETAEDGTISLTYDTPLSGSDNLYYESDGKTPTLPIGTIVIHEVQAPTGYINNNEDVYWVRSVTAEGNTETVETYDAPDGDTSIKEQVKKR